MHSHEDHRYPEYFVAYYEQSAEKCRRMSSFTRDVDDTCIIYILLTIEQETQRKHSNKIITIILLVKDIISSITEAS